MIYDNDSVALDYTDCKQSALYYDNIIPLNFDVFMDLAGNQLKQDLSCLLPKEFENWELDEFLDNIYCVPELFGDGQYKKIKDSISPVLLAHSFFEIRRDWFRNMRAGLGILGMNGIAPGEIELMGFYLDNLLTKMQHIKNTVNVIPSNPENFRSEQEGEDVLFRLTKLNLIDTENVSWEQIFAIREDPDTIRKLRKLKTFFYSSYSGKSQSYIEDDIAKRMEEYKEAANSAGFKLKSAILEGILSSKSLIALSGGTIIAAAMGAPNIATIAASGGAALELSKIGLTILKVKKERIDNIKAHPLEFIFETNKTLSE